MCSTCRNVEQEIDNTQSREIRLLMAELARQKNTNIGTFAGLGILAFGFIIMTAFVLCFSRRRMTIMQRRTQVATRMTPRFAPNHYRGGFFGWFLWYSLNHNISIKLDRALNCFCGDNFLKKLIGKLINSICLWIEIFKGSKSCPLNLLLRQDML